MRNCRIYGIIIKIVLLIVLCVAVGVTATVSSASETEMVNDGLFSVNANNSHVEYGTYKVKDHDFGGNLNDQDCEITGAKINLSAGDELKYNKVINLNGKTENDVLARIVITPQVIGTMDFSQLYLVLTDAYDEENYISISVSGVGETWGRAYALAKASCGQLYSGWAHNENRLYVGEYGYPFALSFAGTVNSDNFLAWQDLSLADNAVAFSFDYENKALYHKERKSSLTSALVTDFDEPTEHTELWKGFTTGECFLSIKCDSYFSSTANFIVTEVAGEKIVSVGKFEKTAPILDISFGEYAEDTIPVAAVGKLYPLFDAVAVSPYYKNLFVSIKVIDKSNNSEIFIDDGKFVPEKPGKYEIKYAVRDGDGNISEKNYCVIAEEYLPPIEIEVGEKIQNGVAGYYISLPEVNAYGGSGNKTITYQVSKDGKSKRCEENRFFADEPGEYTVTITAVDYVGNYEKENYDVIVAGGNVPVFTERAVLPKYFISGEKVILPTLYAKNYTDGSGEKILATITYNDKDGEKNARNFNEIVPVVEKNGDIVKVVYTAKLGKEKAVSEYYVKVVKIYDENTKINHSNLFYTLGYNSVLPQEKGIRFDFPSNAKFDYVNPSVANGFSIKFAGIKGKSNYRALEIMIADAKNPDKYLLLTYISAAGYTAVTLNDDDSAIYKTEKTFNGGEAFSLSLDNFSGIVKYDDENSKKIQVKKYYDGSDFSGFDSGLIYLSFRFDGVSYDSSFTLLSLNGKSKFSSDTDSLKPKISLLTERGGDRKIDEILRVPRAVATDVVDGRVTVLITVVNPLGEVCFDTNGVKLENVSADRDYEVNLSLYGKYEITYVAKDKAGNSEDTSYIARVADEIPPKLTINGEIKTNIRVGEKIKIPSVTVKDNYDENITVYVCLITDTGNIIDLSDGVFVPFRSGKYTIRYYCYDKAGNFVSQDFCVTVEE